MFVFPAVRPEFLQCVVLLQRSVVFRIFFEESLWKLLMELLEALENKMFFQDKLIKDGNMQNTFC